MTIDEAIEKFKFIANSDAPCPRYCMLPCDKCVDESKQLAEWLEDYKRIKMLIPIEQALKAEYNKAIDDVMNMLNDIEFGGGTKETLACANATLNYIKKEVKELRSDG